MAIRYGWKLTGPHFNTMNGFVWDVTGAPNISNHDIQDHHGSCPGRDGDGLTVLADYEYAKHYMSDLEYQEYLRSVFQVVEAPTWLLRVHWDTKDELSVGVDFTGQDVKRRIGGPVYVESVSPVAQLLPLAAVLPIQPIARLSMPSSYEIQPAPDGVVGYGHLAPPFVQCRFRRLVSNRALTLRRCTVAHLELTDTVVVATASHLAAVATRGDCTIREGGYQAISVENGTLVLKGSPKIHSLDVREGATVHADRQVRIGTKSGPGRLVREGETS